MGNRDRTEAVSWFEDLFCIIDAAAWGDLSRFFHLDVVYERPGYEPIVGLHNLRMFYTSTRIVAHGKHSIEGGLRDNDKAICWGRFTGLSRSGVPLAERFADAYRLDNGLIRKRTTYFFRAAM